MNRKKAKRFFVVSLVVSAIGLVCMWKFSRYDSEKAESVSSENSVDLDKVIIFGSSPGEGGEGHKVALAEKMAKELELNKYAMNQEALISAKTIYEKLIERGAVIDRELEGRMMKDGVTADDWREITILISDFLSVDESFNVELSQYSNFQELKRAFDERRKSTGRYYGNELLAQESAYKDATVADILGVLNTGAVLPEDAALLMMRSNNLALISDLQKAGHAVDVNYMDKYQSQNLLEAYVASYSIYDDGRAIETIDQILQLGVPVIVNDGTRDPLDYVLANVTPSNAASRFSVAKKLMSSGLVLGASHNELLDQLKINNPDLYKEFIK